MNVHQLKRTKETIEILRAVGFPIGVGEFRTRLRQDRVAHVLLAVAKLGPSQAWSELRYVGDGHDYAPRSREILRYINATYGGKISDGSYDDIRRKNLDFLVEAGLVIRAANRPDASTNDGTRGYAISRESAPLFANYGKRCWFGDVQKFISEKGQLSEMLLRPRKKAKVEVIIPSGEKLELSVGPHNELQKAIIEYFVPYFLKKPELLYLGDTTQKALFRNDSALAEIGFPRLEHETLPDIVAIDREQQWLYLIEAVHSANPITQLRHLTLERMTAKCKLGKVYVSAFPDRDSFKNWIATLSWETEVWIASEPTHMIHFNGDRFLGPHGTQ